MVGELSCVAVESAFLTGTTLLTPFFAAVAGAPGANISESTLTSMFTFCAATVPALADNTPAAYSSLGTNISTGFTGIITNNGNRFARFYIIAYLF